MASDSDNGQAPSNHSRVGVTPESIAQDFGVNLPAMLDLGTWQEGRDPAAELAHMEVEVARAVACETEYQAEIRRRIYPALATLPDAPPGAGHYIVPAQDVAAAHSSLLFNGAVEACDGNSNVHPSLALTIYQIGVALVSYHGDCATWQHRLYRCDLRAPGDDPLGDVLALLQRRGRRGSLEERDRDVMSELGRRGLMSFGERAALARRARAKWRMGHGSPAPLELLCNYFTDLVIESIRVIRELIAHERFVFVASEPADRALLTIGQGLHPLEYVIVGTLRDRIEEALGDWRQAHPATVDTTWDGTTLTPAEWVIRFRDEIAPRVVYGVYRATRLAPPQLFYAHVNHAHVAARVALADSVLQEERGFPQLIHLADRYLHETHGSECLREMAQMAYAAAGAPYRYGSERQTRGDL